MSHLRKICILLVLTAMLLGFSLSPPTAKPVQAQGATVVYNLYATDGFVTLADGTKAYIYGFVGGRAGQPLTYMDSKTGLAVTLTGGAPTPTGGPVTAAEAPLLGNAQFPAPIIYASVGEVVEIRLKNLGVTQKKAPNDPHSIHLHGLDVNAANDGVPETSVGAVPANSVFPGAGNVIVYMFTATHPGTYMYHCHQEADIHVQMGMYGALVVYNPTDAAAAGGPNTGGGNLWGWDYDRDYVLLLSEFDLGQHFSELSGGGGGGYNPVNFKPQYWFINGLSFPQTIHVAPVGAPVLPAGQTWFNNVWLPSHPGYDPFIVGHTEFVNPTNGATGEKILLRVINMGFQTQPMHMHGFHGKIIGSDQRAWPWTNAPTGEGLEKNTLTIGSGETYEWLLDFGVWTGKAAGMYEPGTQSKMTVAGAPVVNTDPAGVAIPDPFAPVNVPPLTYIGGPVVGPELPAEQFSVPGHLLTLAGMSTFGGQLFPFHNHDDYKATNNGVYPGGMFTMIATVP